MLHLIRLELVKLRRSRYIGTLLVVLAIATVSYYGYVHQKSISLEEARATIKETHDSFQAGYEDVVKQIEEAEKNGGKLDQSLENLAVVSKRQVDAHQLIYEGIQKQDWSLYWQGELLDSEWTAENKEEELNTVIKSYRWPTPFTVFAYRDQMKLMADYEIQPVFPTNEVTWKTLYDQEYDTPLIEEIVSKYSRKYSATGFFFNYYLFDVGLGLIGLLVLVFLFADFITKEGFQRNGPIHLIRTQPMKRMTFWMAKSVTVLAVTIGILLLVGISGLIIGSLFDRLGDWNYPVLIYGEERSYSFLTTVEFIARGIGLFILLAAFSFGLLFLFSIMTQRAIVALGLTVLVLLVGQLSTQQTILLSWAHWLPFYYMDVYSIVSGEYAVIQENFEFTYRQGLVTTLVWTGAVICGAVGVAKLKKGVRI